MIKTMKGGEVNGSGSYGCVFKPPLKCKNTQKNMVTTKNKKTKKNLISKLVLRYEGAEEYSFNKTVVDRIKKLDNYKIIKKYFMVIDDICVPEKLKKRDKESLITRCENMVSKEYLENKLENIAILNMKYGGINIDSYIISSIGLEEVYLFKFISKLIGNLIDLMENGISVMHNVNLYHTDIKSLNLLLSNNKKYISMIDWGLSIVELPKHYDSVYSGIHFNRPYESLLFNINDNEIIMNRELLIDEIINSYLDKINRTSLGNDIYLLFNNENIIPTLKEYLLLMLDQVVVSNRFSREKLIKAFYVKQDYWGIMTVLMDLYKYLNLRNSIYENSFRNIFEYMTRNLRINKSVLIGLLKKIEKRIII